MLALAALSSTHIFNIRYTPNICLTKAQIIEKIFCQLPLTQVLAYSCQYLLVHKNKVKSVTRHLICPPLIAQAKDDTPP